MISKRKLGIALIVIFTINVFFTMMPQIEGAMETQNIYIVDTINDGFVTEVGNWFYQTGSVSILDPNMDITAYLVFRDLEINRWEHLNNATIRLYAPGLLPEDLDSSVTIRGVKVNNFLGFENGAQVTQVAKTSAFVNVNTSAFTGGFQYIDVTEIVRELTSVATWTGDGHSGTDDKDNLGFVILGAEGSEARYFYDFSLGNNLGPRLTVVWGDEPAPPAPPGAPPTAPDPIFNETIGNNTIWEIPDPDLNENRTGAPPAIPVGIHVNWNVVNLTDLTEFDPGNDIIRQNGSWASVSTMLKSAIGSIYNDTGAPANITSFFARFAVNVTAVNSAIAGNDPIPGLMALSTSAPTGAGGMGYGVAGEWIGLMLQVNQDDQRWRVVVRDRDGVADALGGTSTWFFEVGAGMLYFECRIDTTAGYVNYNIFNDPLYRDLNQTRSYAITLADAPFRYSQLVVGMAQAGGSLVSMQYYTFLTPVDLGGTTTWCVSDINGTIISCDFDNYEDAKDFADDLLGPDPSDPDPPYQGWPQEGPFQRYRTRLYILLIGAFLIFGPLISFSLSRPSGYEFTIGVFIMVVGFALLIAAGSV